MRRYQHQRARKDRGGAALVEFSICFPVLLSFVFGIIEFSRLLQLEHTVRLASFAGARAGVTLDSATSDVQAATLAALAISGVVSPTITITPNPIAYTSPTVTVTVSISAVQNAWLTWFVNGNQTITSTTTLSREVNGVSVP